MTGHPEEPPFGKYGGWYFALKIAVLAVAALLALKLIGLL
jgi:hypothetical protein